MTPREPLRGTFGKTFRADSDSLQRSPGYQESRLAFLLLELPWPSFQSLRHRTRS